MEKYFNTEGICNPRYHYMVPLDDRLSKIRQRYVERGSYFVINRGRQYGKTTTLRALAEYLRSDYIVLSIDFQEIGTAEFQDEAAFCKAFAEVLIKASRNNIKAEDGEGIFCADVIAQMVDGTCSYLIQESGTEQISFIQQ